MRHDPTPLQAQFEVPPPAGALAALPDAGAIAWFDQIRALMLQNALPPEPPVYELLWRYVRDEDHELSLAIDRAIAGKALTLDMINELRARHMAQINAADVTALVAAARGQAEALTERLASGQTDLKDYNEAIANSGARLAEPLDAPGLADLLAQMGEATQRMQAANAVLLAELDLAAAESRGLAKKLLAAERAAVTDVLTGVLNRRGSITAIEQAQTQGRSDGTPFSLAVVDIDHFKRFNDRYGHAMGDDVLRFVAQHLANRVEDRGGSVGRLGGEEFVVLMPGDAMGAATGVLDRIRAELAGQVLRSATDGTSMGRISFSAGVAQDKLVDNADTLLERADRALYTAKRMGRDRVIPGHS